MIESRSQPAGDGHHACELRGPLVAATWSFAVRGVDRAWPQVFDGGDPLDACLVACEEAENDERVDSVGFGGLPDADGVVTVDGCVMRAPDLHGAVCGLGRLRHPCRVAREVMVRTPHRMLVGEAADRFAATCGFEEQTMLADAAARNWAKWRRDGATPDQSRDGGLRPIDRGDGSFGALFERGGSRLDASRDDGGRDLDEEARWRHHDTIGVLALARDGALAGACSTSGAPFKMPGRVGDSPIVGHGLYVDPAIGAVVGTGAGELAMGVCAAFLAVEAMRRGAEPAQAGREALMRIASTHQLVATDQFALLVLRADGAFASAALREGYRSVIRTTADDQARVCEPDLVLFPGT